MNKRIFFSVGEPSGDLHGANLIRALQARGEVSCFGYGGPRMAAAGCELHADLTELAIMWLKQVFTNLPRFWALYRQAEATFAEARPDAVVLIDYPGFNWWIAKAARKHRIPVFYYGVPQLWAWGGWRVRKMRRLVDHVLCKLPFEADWYNRRGCRATYVGHPYFDELSERRLDDGFVHELKRDPRRVVTILPGSRTQEIRNNLPWFVRAAERLTQDLPGTRFVVASFNERQAELARQLAAGSSVPLEIYAARTPELIHAADLCWACSGSVSLELMYHEKPSAILYWVPKLQYWLVRHLLIQVRYMTLVNLLASPNPFQGPIRPFDPRDPDASAVPFPEYPTCEDRSVELAQHAREWLTDEAARAAKVAQLQALKAQFAQPGASQAAAEWIHGVLHQPGSVRAAA